jgi:hypothetical protein
LNAFSLKRDSSEITYTITRTEEDKEYTNQDVLLTILLNKKVESIDGFTISEDGKSLTKNITENESETIIVEDDSGNKKEISYDINNIDKISPEIIGVEDGETYGLNQTVEYKDNIGIKNIFIDRYSSLSFSAYTDYYDTSFYKGIDLLSNSINVNITGHPKGTVKYLYYLNNVLKEKTTNTNYKYTGLTANTYYTVKVVAVDENDNVLETKSRSLRTKYFSTVVGEKGTNTFKVTVYGIDNRVEKLIAIGYTNSNNQKNYYPSINSDRSVTFTFSATEVTGSLQSGYYYFHIQMFDSTYSTLYDTLCCNVIFGTKYTNTAQKIDPYKLTTAGNYQIIVTDFAGNKTEKNIIIK